MDKLLNLAGSVMGNVISTVSIILALIAGWNDMNTSIATNAAQIQSQQVLIEQTSDQLRELRNDIKIDLNRITEQINRQGARLNAAPPMLHWRKKNNRWEQVPYDSP